ncbi:hypothetical protein BDW22DRAFT_690743 [Trametopsis cervina]|nr:hypothetical protein BDW22DRAFT_690743 [Trametopsis cervina]
MPVCRGGFLCVGCMTLSSLNRLRTHDGSAHSEQGSYECAIKMCPGVPVIRSGLPVNSKGARARGLRIDLSSKLPRLCASHRSTHSFVTFSEVEGGPGACRCGVDGAASSVEKVYSVLRME